ncbi:bifunctional aspartate transaminase/aspartate 4-decarboxylase [Acetobacterium paludosum]|uniref:Bifunctional aspartate transaminase/aspartate 4-decarboxylase n=1 Tax=Acetobacterium paludosum TaxID=52693 RepID=A0A923HQ39_9FIRM|nr:bifunctional aspartate transaminase/aspartate 4-decarboxylase [Acetobacterium paludosum]MBC3886769.1 bifunctional aspartate transaminase/aspartate 4-decarboxylase [Acetobacterium paludosum]
MNTNQYEKKLEQLGAFEIASKMLKVAKNNENHNSFLNAGRGNPNWINTQARLAFTRFMAFGVKESERTMLEGNLAGYTTLDGISGRLNDFLDLSQKEDAFIQTFIDYGVDVLDIDRDALVKEFTDAIIGNNYPVPSRCLVNIEKIINVYLQDTLYNGVSLADSTQVFPTEGGTAAICYIFNSLKKNGLIQEGDRIAINMPIFTPYLQIPKLTNYKMVEVDLEAREDNDWEIPLGALDILEDESIKAFFLVNPSNPASRALDSKLLKRIKEICEKRRDLIIITDDVYGTFVDGFQTVYAVAPYNTLLVYSYSKLYGATGWRTGCIAMNKQNVFDDLIARLPEEKLKVLDKDYSIVTMEPRSFPFIERLTADSRSIGLYHTSGLSTPQQAMMALFSLTHLVCHDGDNYIESTKEIVAKRYHNLFEGLGIKEDNTRENAKYYALIDIYNLAERLYGENLATYIRKNFEEIDFLLNLAKEEGLVIMEGVGFAATPGTLRVSQANLADDAYPKIAKRIIELLKEYDDKMKTSLEEGH